MKQLVELQENLGEQIKQHDASVLVIFREESKGQEGLQKVVEQTETDIFYWL